MRRAPPDQAAQQERGPRGAPRKGQHPDDQQDRRPPAAALAGRPAILSGRASPDARHGRLTLGTASTNTELRPPGREPRARLRWRAWVHHSALCRCRPPKQRPAEGR